MGAQPATRQASDLGAQSSSESILDAAEELFAASGYDAVTIKQIAAKARVNVALIYYYHDSKETLYRHIIERFVGDLVRKASRRLETAANPEEAIRAVTLSQFEILSAKPHLPRLIIRELIDYQATHAVGVLRDLGAAVFSRLVAAITEGQRRGLFRRDLDARFAAFSTIAQLPYFFVARPALGALALGDTSHGDAATDAAFARHAGDFAVAALRESSTSP